MGEAGGKPAVSRFMVRQSVAAPARAAARAASQPAGPAPITATSYKGMLSEGGAKITFPRLFPYAEFLEDDVQEVFDYLLAGDLAQRSQGSAQFFRDQLLAEADPQSLPGHGQ